MKRLLEIKLLQENGLKLGAILEVLKKGEEPELVPVRELWIKYPINQGIEIHISRDLEEKERKKIAEIIRITRSILTSGGKDNE